MRSLQRFELGESGEGKGLRSKAATHDDPLYDAALVQFIAEEHRCPETFGPGIDVSRVGGR